MGGLVSLTLYNKCCKAAMTDSLAERMSECDVHDGKS